MLGLKFDLILGSLLNIPYNLSIKQDAMEYYKS